MKKSLELIDEFQCPGCIHGINTGDCASFDLRQDVSFAACLNHHPSTFVGGIGRIALGLPKGFNRCGQLEFRDKPYQTCYIRLYDSPEKMQVYDKFNVAVWAMEKDGYLFVRCYSPRINQTFVDVIKGGKLEHVPGALNVAEFINDMD